MYGTRTSPSQYNPHRSVIGNVENAPGGNVILRVGREAEQSGWIQTEHVVLEPREAEEFAREVEEAARPNLVGLAKRLHEAVGKLTDGEDRVKDGESVEAIRGDLNDARTQVKLVIDALMQFAPGAPPAGHVS